MKSFSFLVQCFTSSTKSSDLLRSYKQQLGDGGGGGHGVPVHSVDVESSRHAPHPLVSGQDLLVTKQNAIWVFDCGVGKNTKRERRLAWEKWAKTKGCCILAKFTERDEVFIRPSAETPTYELLFSLRASPLCLSLPWVILKILLIFILGSPLARPLPFFEPFSGDESSSSSSSSSSTYSSSV